MKRLYASSLLLLALLVGCATTPQSPAQAVYQAHGDYAAGLIVFNEYKRLPPCSGVPGGPLLCKDLDVEQRVQKADNEAFQILSEAQAVVRGMVPSTPAEESKKVDEARAATKKFRDTTNPLKVK